MVKKISLNIPDDRYKDLAKLSDFYKLDMKDSITQILDAVGGRASSIETMSKEYRVPVKLDTVLNQILSAGLGLMSLIFNEVLEKLEVKGLGIIDDFGYDLDEEDFWFHYSLLKGCGLKIGDIFVHLEPGLKTLSTYPFVEVEKVGETAVRKLKKLIETESFQLPDEFDELEEYNIEIFEEGEEFLTLRIDCVADSLYYLPSGRAVSKFVEQIYVKAGIN